VEKLIALILNKTPTFNNTKRLYHYDFKTDAFKDTLSATYKALLLV